MRHRDPRTGQIVSTVVLGRKFCTKCGRWRHLCYFRPRRRGERIYPQPDCDGCHNRTVKKDSKNMTGARRALRQEYDRIYHEGLRRKRGVVPITNGRAPAGRDKDVPRRQLDAYLKSLQLSNKELARITGVDEKTIRNVGSANIRLSVGDQILTRLGVPHLTYVFWGELE